MSTANYVYYDTTSSSFTEATALTVTAINSSNLPTSWAAGYYVVGADYNGDGVINAADAAYAAETGQTTSFTISKNVTYTGDVKLILADGFSLTASNGIIAANSSSDITIYGQRNNTGSLTATGTTGSTSYSAGIGSASGNCGNITIHGGSVTATGGKRSFTAFAAGIGSRYGSNGTSYGTITIYGGNVDASINGASALTSYGGIGGKSGSGIYVNDTSTLKAGTKASPTTTIDHTLDEDVSSALSSTPYVTVTSPNPEVIKNYTLLLSGGTAYKNSVAAENVVTITGLSYADGVWTMNGVDFTTSAETAVEVADAVTISVIGANTITGSGDTNTCGLKFDNAAVIAGAGSLTVTAGTGTNACGVYAVSQPAAVAKYNDTTLTFEDNTYKLASGGDVAQTVTLTEIPPNYTIVLDNGVSYRSMDGGETLGEVVAVAGLSYADGVWTMNGVDFTTTATTAMKVNDAVVITVTGANTVTGGSGAAETYGLKFANTSTIQGTGTLTVTAGTGTTSYGVYADYRKPDATAKTGETTLTFADATYKNGDAIASTVSLTAADKNYGIYLYNGKAYSDKAHSVEITGTVQELGLSYDADSNTWTMENFQFTSGNTQSILSSGNVVAALIIDSETTITVTGNNTVAISDITTAGFATEGIRINANTLMNGNGTLTVIAGNAPSTSVGISYGYADLAVSGNVTLKAYGGTSDSWISAGIYDYNTGYLLAMEQAQIYAYSATSGYTTYGVTLEKPITVLNDASITAVALGTTSNENAGVKVIAGTPAATATDGVSPLTWNPTKLGDSTGTYVDDDNNIAPYVVMTAGAATYTIYCTVDGKVYSDSDHTLDITHLVSVMGLTYRTDHWEMSDFNFSSTQATAIKFEEGASITVSGTNSIASVYSGSDASSGLLLAGDAVLNGTGTLTVTGGTSTTSSYGLNAAALQLADMLTLTATGATGGYYGTSAITTDGTTAVTMYDADGNTLAWANNTYNYNSTPATTVTNYQAPIVFSLTGTANIQPMYAASGVTFSVSGSTVTAAAEGDTVTFTGNAVNQFEVAGYTSDDVKISGNTFQMPAQGVTVKAHYRFNVDKSLNLVVGTYTNELAYSGNGGAGEVQAGGVLTAVGTKGNEIVFTGNTANAGGAIYNASSGTVNVSGAIFSGNTASTGGAIYNNGTMTLTDTAFTTETDTVYNAGDLTLAGTITLAADLTTTKAAKAGADLVVSGAGKDSTDFNGALYGCGHAVTVSDLHVTNNLVGGAANDTAVTATDLTVQNVLAKDLFGGSLASTANLFLTTVETTLSGTQFRNFYGAGYATGNSASLQVTGSVSLNVTGGCSQTASQYGRIYGAGRSANGATLTVADTTISVDNGTSTSLGALYAGGYANGGAALTLTDVTTTITSGWFTSFVAGGSQVYGSGTTSTAAGTTITINSGIFDNAVVGASYAASNATASVTTATTTISGGTFSGYVAGAGYANGGSVTVGSVNFTISGGTFNKYVFGGNLGGSNAAAGTVTNAVNLTLDTTSNNISVTGSIYAGSMNSGAVGSTLVTLSGDGSKLTFSRLYGCGSYTGTQDGGVSGSRELKFNGFSGELSGKLYDFDVFTMTGSQIAFQKPQDLTGVSTWNLNLTSGVDDETALIDWSMDGYNDFTNDTLNLTFNTGAETDLLVIMGDQALDLSLSEGMTVTFNGNAATYSDGSWSADGWKLSNVKVDETNNLVLSKIA